MKARVIATVFTLIVSTIAATAGRADEGVPVLEEPVLRSDSQFEKTSWGYKKKSLTFPAAGSNLAAVLTTEGYSGAGVPDAYLRVADGRLMALRFSFTDRPGYVRAWSSIRGTECSGGSFYLYDRRHAWDQRDIIEFLGTQDWSNGNVGMVGSSFSGQTAFWTAATQPPHLKAVIPNLLHSDIYRDIFMPGAVQNYLFPVIWYLGTPIGGPHRAPYSRARDGTLANDEICAQHQANRFSAQDPPNPIRDYIWHAIEETDNDWYQMHAAATHAPAIRIPYMQQNNWQDEQTGPRAAVLYHYINPDPVTIKDRNGIEHTVIPKKMNFSNGDHGHGGMSGRRQWAFFDIFLRGMPDTLGLFDDLDGNGIADETVDNFIEIRDNGEYTAKKSGETWPFPDTLWTRFYPREGGLLSQSPPTSAELGDSYLSGAATRNYERSAGFGAFPSQVATGRNLPEGVVYQSEPLTNDLAIAGPILFSMYASMTGTDTDFFVSINDVLADGRVSYLQRGLLKASHRDISEFRSFYADDNGNRILVQPVRPHTNPRTVVPGEIIRYDIEIWPLGHIFRAGHSIRIQIHTPPALDGIWGYTATHHRPAAVTVHHDADHPSVLLLPGVTGLQAGTAPPSDNCPVPAGFPCG